MHRARCLRQCASHTWSLQKSAGHGSSDRLIQKLLKSSEDPADLLGPAKIGDGVGNRILVLQTEQRRQLFLVELFHADAHVVRQHEVEKDLLFRIEIGAYHDLGAGSSLLARQRLQRIGYMSQHIEKVALLGIDYFLHLRQLLTAESFFSEALQELP